MKFTFHFRAALALAVLAALAVSAAAQTAKPKKVFVITDLEGVDGIFDFNLQCIPWKSPLYPESRKLLTGEVNAAVAGLMAGGASQVMVYDGHYGGHNLSALTIDPRATLLAGSPVSPTLGLNPTYSALVFIGLHAMAGTRGAILPHSFTWDIQNIWVNGIRVGEIGARVMLAGELGIPAIMLSGDTAACKEFHALVPAADCAPVKTGVSATAGTTLSHPAACALIRKDAQLAMERLDEIKPYSMKGPAEVKVEFATEPTPPAIVQQPGVEQVDGRTWIFRGKTFSDAWLKFRSF